MLHADTFFGDGPAADDPGEVRGIGAPAPVDAGTGRELAAGRLSTRATCVLLADRHGSVQRLLRVGRPPVGGWTRERLVAAIRAQLAKEAGDHTGPAQHRPVRADHGDRRPRPRRLPRLHPARLPPHLQRL